MKTSDLIGPALDWAVWKCTGGADAYPETASGKAFLKLWKYPKPFLHPSTLWDQGGPIIEREKLQVTTPRDGTAVWEVSGLPADSYAPFYWYEGPTLLIAAMRCYVASKLGDEVDIPKELL